MRACGESKGSLEGWYRDRVPVDGEDCWIDDENYFEFGSGQQRGGRTFWLGDRLNHRMPLGLV